jgi:hypothetical protein
VTTAGEEEGRRRRRWHSPIAQALAWKAWRGSARTAGQVQPRVTSPWQHREHLILGASTSAAQPPQPPQTRTSSTTKGSSVASSLEATGVDRTRAGNSPESHRRGGILEIHLVEEVEGSGVLCLPQVAAAEAARAGRNCRAMATAARVRGRARGKRGEGARQVWVGLTDLDPDRLG